MDAIRRLQDRVPPKPVKGESTQTAEISTKTKSRTPSHSSTSDDIPINTLVFAVWFDCDGFAYEVLMHSRHCNHFNNLFFYLE
jgi:hypothetical protein